MITGANGTVGSALKNYLVSQGIEVIGWDRNKVPIDQYSEMERFLKDHHPDILFHLAIASKSTGKNNESWLVNYEWTSELAWLTRILSINFVYTSTARVFSDDARGPFTIHSMPDAKQGYGYEKRLSEERVFHQNSNAQVVRLGWQIGDREGSNNMIDFFYRQMEQVGKIKASVKWFPACSFLQDTAEALFAISKLAPGLYMADSNKEWNFFEIASALNVLHGNTWIVEPTDDFIYDQRLIDERVKITPLNERLENLK